jgi:hypothetical protein
MVSFGALGVQALVGCAGLPPLHPLGAEPGSPSDVILRLALCLSCCCC